MNVTPEKDDRAMFLIAVLIILSILVWQQEEIIETINTVFVDDE